MAQPEECVAEAPAPGEGEPCSPSAAAPSQPERWEWQMSLAERAERLPSDSFTLAGFSWRLVCYPRGNRDPSKLSLYLEAVYDGPLTPRRASFRLSVVGSAKQFSMEALKHVFNQNENQSDWGFGSLAPLVDLKAPQGGFLSDAGEVTLRAEVWDVEERAFFSSNTSKEDTGFVGLKNQGATCYMNSLLQTLFHLPAFRRAVYSLPTEAAAAAAAAAAGGSGGGGGRGGKAAPPIPLALQSLFCKMQLGSEPADTRALTRSFGWTSAESFTQHDVQELNRVLCDNLEAKMKGTAAEGALQRLFEGEMEMAITCTEVAFRSARRETFMDLQLDVKGCADVAASLAKYCEEEVMDGENKYAAEGHGLQVARKGTRFVRLPPVMQLHLRRFEYDYASDTAHKVNDRYAFPAELDMGPYLAQPAGGEAGEAGGGDCDMAEAPPAPLYRLHSVLVHSGGAHGGHYFAFIRPGSSDERWFRFDDEHVTAEKRANAVEANFGEAEDKEAKFRFRSSSSAYMLVYVRCGEAAALLAPLGAEDIPPHIRACIEEEERAAKRRMTEDASRHLFTHVRVAGAAELRERSARGGAEAVGLLERDAFEPVGFEARLANDSLFGELMERCAAALGAPLAQQRWFFWGERQNLTYRPSPPAPADAKLSIAQLVKARAALAAAHGEEAGGRGCLRLYLHCEPEGAPARPPAADALLFVKLYHPGSDSLRLLCSALLPTAARLRDLPRLLPAGALPGTHSPLTRCTLVEENSPERVDPLDEADSLSSAKLGSGDIVILTAEAEAGQPPPRNPTPAAHLAALADQMWVCFRPLPPASGAEHRLSLSRRDDYDTVAAALAGALGLVEPSRLRFTPCGYGSSPGMLPLLYRDPGRNSLAQMVGQLWASSPDPPLLFYEPLDMPLPLLQTLRDFSAVLHSAARGEAAKPLSARVPKDGYVGDLLEALQPAAADALPPGPGEAPRLRLLEVSLSRISRLFGREELLSSVWLSSQLRVEWEAEAEAAAAAAAGEARLVSLSHAAADSSLSSFFGDPLLLWLAPAETAAGLLARVAARLGVQPADAAAWRLAAQASTYAMTREALAAEAEVLPALAALGGDAFLVLEHEAGSAKPRRNAHRSLEKAIVITG